VANDGRKHGIEASRVAQAFVSRFPGFRALQKLQQEISRSVRQSQNTDGYRSCVQVAVRVRHSEVLPAGFQARSEDGGKRIEVCQESGTAASSVADTLS